MDYTDTFQYTGIANSGNLQSVLFSRFNRYFLNSIFVSGIAVTLTILITSLASYAFAKMKFHLSPLIFTLFIIGMLIPVHTTIIPIFQLTKAMRLTDRLLGLLEWIYLRPDID